MLSLYQISTEVSMLECLRKYYGGYGELVGHVTIFAILIALSVIMSVYAYGFYSERFMVFAVPFGIAAVATAAVAILNLKR
jgi:hypothetical protein